MKSKTSTKSKYEQDYVRNALKEVIAGGTTQGAIAAAIGLNHGNLSRFINGRQSLSDASIEALYDASIVRQPEPHEIDPKAKIAAPLIEWDGETKTVKEVAEEKGYCYGTIMKWAKEGKLNYVRDGRRIMIVIDETYLELPKSMKAQMLDRIAELEAENAAVKAENVELKAKLKQATFAWEEENKKQEAKPVVIKKKQVAKKAQKAKVKVEKAEATNNSKEFVEKAESEPVKYYQAIELDNDNRPICGLFFAAKMEIGDNGLDKIAYEHRNGTVKSGTLEIDQILGFAIEIDRTRQTVAIPNRIARKLIGK